ncbi:ABC transporter permease [Macrococcus capreoli]|uniref:ABC transporter permease n=1 Tax=Macrococcus capreoli TaxID=2982690 RepID=UPI0021D5C6C5|nr:ABC transporter permease [Macrococcus sp. TMW 2.2395]MCU7556994.1 ABC transporter permease [Macrococcus sp. TMW 2.2395]
MKILKNKLIYLVPIVALLIIGLLSLAFSPAYNPKPKEMPIAIVNLDKGIEIQGKSQNIGKSFIDKLQSTKDFTEKVKLIEVKDERELTSGFKDLKYYGALVIPETFTSDATSAMRKEIQTAKKAEGEQKAKAFQTDIQQKIASGTLAPAQAQVIIQEMKTKQAKMLEANKDLLKPIDVKQGELKVMINQGASTQGAQITDTILSNLTTKLNDTIASQAVTQLDKANVSVSAKSMNQIMYPVNVDHTVMNKIHDHQAMGNAPMLFFTPIWLGSLLSSVLLYFAFRGSNIVPKRERFIASLFQIIAASVTAIIGGFGGVWFITSVLGFDMPDTFSVSIYISIAMFGFIMLILGLMSWLGMPALPLFMLALFFSMQLLTLPKQMLPEFYQDHLFDWNPFKIYGDGIRQLIYLGHELEFNTPMQMYLGLGIFGVIAIILAAVIRPHKEK